MPGVSTSALPRRSYIGLALANAPAPNSGQGLLVKDVAFGSSATRAGVLRGDWLISINGTPATDLAVVRALLREFRAGSALELSVRRGQQLLHLKTAVVAYPREVYAGARVVLDQVEADGQLLRALAVVPEGKGPFPVLYYLPGAHWASEEYSLQPQHPIPTLLGALANVGIASVRIERSGLGDSQGPACTQVDYQGEIAGYRAGLELLRRADWAAHEQVILFGYSIGAMHAPIIAEAATPRGVITFGAGAVPISQGLIGAIVRHAELRLGNRAEVRARGEQVAELIRLVVCEQRTPAEVFELRPDLEAIAPSHFHDQEAYRRTVHFYHQLEQVDIGASWRRYSGPLLALHGARDYITALEDSAQLAAWCGPQARAVQLPGVDHQMSDSPLGAPERLAQSLEHAVVNGTLHQLGRHHD